MPKLVKATLSMGDHHLGEGDATPKLEDFPHEIGRAYVEMLEAHLQAIGAGVEYDHVILGDWFDLLAVRYKGRYGVVPFEEAGLAKVETVLKAHETYIAAMRELLVRYPNLRYRIVIGNHDLEFRWISVQESIIRALAPENATHRVTFHEEWAVGETVLHVHGDAYDSLNANPSQEEAFKEDVMISRTVIALVFIVSLVFGGALTRVIFAWVPYTIGGIALGTILSYLVLLITLRGIAGWLAFRFGRTLTTLNVRTASYMHSGLGMWLKRRFFPDINRRADHGTIYVLGIARKPYASFLIVPALLIEALAHKFFHAFRHPRDRFHLSEFGNLILSTMRPDQYEKELCKFLETKPNVRHIIVGHTHDTKVVSYDISGRTVMYHNSGIAGWQMRTSTPEVACRTNWPGVETFFRRVAYHWRHAPYKALLSTLAYAAFPALLFLLPPLPVLVSLRWPAALLSAFLLLWWQSAAEYKDTMLFRHAPCETLEFDEGPPQVRILEYEQGTRRFRLLTGEEATWDHQ